jgi:hypothetical protein
MKITIGEWKTRDGRKAIVGAINESAALCSKAIGWVNGSVFSWETNGSWASDEARSLDLIEPWTDPVPWDWSTTPPWINWIAMDSNGRWWMYEQEPLSDASGWIGYTNSSAFISPSYAPKWSGDWKLSKTMRPKEVK